MRSERALVAGLALLFFGCPEEKGAAPPTSRFAGVTSKAPSGNAEHFCDQAYPAAGDGARGFKSPATRPLAGAAAPGGAKGWRWVNAWATWCTPCIEEMALLTRWRDALKKDQVEVSFELFSIDAAEAEAKLKGWLSKPLPGAVGWVRSEEDFGLWLDALGVSRDSAIPIHALVDPKGQLRCVRVGAVHEQDFGAVRALLSAN